MMTQSRSTRSSSPLRQRLSVFHLVVLVFILVVGVFLRFYHIGKPSLWKDEIWSIETSMGRGSVNDRLPANFIRTDQPDLTGLASAAPWWSIWTHVGDITHPPLYFVLLRWWMDLFGTGAEAIRSLSAIASVASIPVFFDVCRFLHGNRIALLATAIMALALGQVEYAFDARAYALLVLAGLGCIDLLLRIELFGASKIRLVALALCCAAATLTHYIVAGPLLGLGTYAAIRLPARARWSALAALAAGAILTLVVWVPLLGTQTRTLPSLAATFLREAHMEKHGKLTLYRVIGLPAEFLLGESGGEALARRSPNLVLGIFLLTMVVPVIRLYWRRDLLLWVLCMLGNIGSVVVIDLLHGTTLAGYPRYTLLTSPAIFAVIASFDWPRVGALRDLVPIVCIAALTVAAADHVTSPPDSLEDWRQLAADLDSETRPNDLLIYSNPDPWVTPGLFYMCLKYYSPQSQHPWLILRDPAYPQLLARISTYPDIWVIGGDPQNDGPRLLPGWRPQTLISTSAGSACRMVPP
jgi:uncharacterized membrane protein